MFLAKVASLILLLIAVSDYGSAAGHWSYQNFDKWPGTCLSGKLQSPVDLNEKAAVEKTFTQLQFKNYDVEYTAMMKNNKHSVEVRFLYTDKQPSISGGNLPNEYILDGLHFHWASEHTINGRRYPLELHLVHYNARLGNISAAMNTKEGIAVLGVLFNLSPDDDDDLMPMVELIDSISKTPDKLVELKYKIAPIGLLPCDRAGYYRYEGSLTTPNCNEVVIWTVFTNPQTLSHTQVKYFETIRDDRGPLVTNFRPIQKLHGRLLMLKRSPLNHATKNSVALSMTLILVTVARLL